jgi:3-oxoacyl-[acyl-carrier protein] reductase
VRNVLVSGGSRGLGLAIGSMLAAAGYRVIALARTETKEFRAAATAAERAQQGALHFRGIDLMDTRAIGPVVAGVRKEFGPLYGLINNAGIGTHGVLAITRDEDLERLVRLNTISPIILTKYAVRSMLVERAGRIVNVASIVASTGYSGLAAYAATKASLVGFTRSLAREVGQLGITVNAIAPGFLDTEMTRELGAEDRQRIERRSALRRLAGTEDVASAVEFLLSDKAKNITGITLTVDAGSTA